MARNRSFTGITAPNFVVDHSSVARSGGRQPDWDAVGESHRLVPGQIVKMNGAVIADATPLTVDPVAFAIPAGMMLYFGELGEQVRVSADVAAGAVAIPVDAAHAAIEDNDEAVIRGSGVKRIRAGTVLAELPSGKVIPRADVDIVADPTHTAAGIAETEMEEGNRNDALTGYGMLIGGALYENLLPEATGTPKVLPALFKTELAAAAGVLGFAFHQYGDSRAS